MYFFTVLYFFPLWTIGMTNNMKKVFKSTKSSPALILEPIKESDSNGKNKKVSCMVVMVVTGIMGCMPCRSGFPVKGQSHHIFFTYICFSAPPVVRFLHLLYCSITFATDLFSVLFFCKKQFVTQRQSNNFIRQQRILLRCTLYSVLTRHKIS